METIMEKIKKVFLTLIAAAAILISPVQDGYAAEAPVETSSLAPWFSSNKSRILGVAITTGAAGIAIYRWASWNRHVNAVDQDGWTPLYLASLSGHEPVVRILLEHGANVNAADHTGWTTLHSASCRGHEPVVQILLEHGANVNAATHTGWTPLHSASWSGHEPVIQILLTARADVNTLNHNGDTPAMIARARGHTDLATKLEIAEDITTA
jgi:hypothetical protein